MSPRVLLARVRTRGRLRTGRGVRIGRGCRFALRGAARVTLADGCVIGDRARFDVDGGEVRIGLGARIGDGFIVLCHERVETGPRLLAGDDVVLQDAARAYDDPERPIRAQGILTAPVVIGAGVVLGPRAVVEPGATIGDGAVVEPGSQVLRDVPAGAVVVGVPAGVAGPAGPPRDGGAGTPTRPARG